MRTFYIDVFFLINFTVDLISLYVCVRVLHARARMWRIALAALLGGAVAVVDAFIYTYPLLRVLLFFSGIIGASFIAISVYGIRRRIKFIAVFFTVELLLGGAVSFCYSMLDELFDSLGIKGGGSENRGALILSRAKLASVMR